jgi:hypothetical protein
MSGLPRKGIVATMYAEHIYLTFSCADKMHHTLVHGVEESLPVERAAFKYDGKP